MQGISAFTTNKAIQPVNKSEDPTEENTSTAPTETTEEPSEFDVFLKGLLSPDAANNVNEEELFSALIQERLKKVKGTEAEQKFSELLNKHKDHSRAADGYIPIEDAAKTALKEMRDAGDLTAEETDKIYSEAFSAAQLDSNTNALFDGRGGTEDATIAIAGLEQALMNARLKIEKFDDGSESAEVRTVDEASNSKIAPTTSAATALATSDAAISLEPEVTQGTTFDGANGFLFKPISENQNSLAILLPEVMAHKVASVVLKDENNNVLEEGQSTGYGDLGTREKFSFSKQGQDYGSNITVEVRLNDGSIKTYSIPDPSQRYD